MPRPARTVLWPSRRWPGALYPGLGMPELSRVALRFVITQSVTRGKPGIRGNTPRSAVRTTPLSVAGESSPKVTCVWEAQRPLARTRAAHEHREGPEKPCPRDAPSSCRSPRAEL